MKHGSDTMRRAPWLVVGLLLLVGCGIQDGKAECIHGGDPGAGCSLPSVSTCPSGQTFCEGTGCVDTSSASNHCGACGSACPVGQTCSDGNCVPSVVTCTDGLAFCAGAGCVDLSARPDHCGECGRRCESGETCRDGQCYAPTDAGTPMDVPVDPLGAVTAPCVAGEEGADRDCGWRRSERTLTCTPGRIVVLGCAPFSDAGLTPICERAFPAGSVCHGDPVLRACPVSSPCRLEDRLPPFNLPPVSYDDYCSETCPLTHVRCPSSGQLEVLTGDYSPGLDTGTCQWTTREYTPM